MICAVLCSLWVCLTGSILIGWFRDKKKGFIEEIHAHATRVVLVAPYDDQFWLIFQIDERKVLFLIDQPCFRNEMNGGMESP